MVYLRVRNEVVVNTAFAVEEAEADAEVDPPEKHRPECRVAELNVGEDFVGGLLESYDVVDQVGIHRVGLEKECKRKPMARESDDLLAAEVSVDLLLLLPVDIGLMRDVELVTDHCVGPEDRY